MLERFYPRLSLALIISLLGLFIIAFPPPVKAQSLTGMSCYDLWYTRNQIYADNGYCFKTTRARAVFGAGCFAPFGRLSTNEQAWVNAIKQRELGLGCAAGGQVIIPPVIPPTIPQLSSIYASMGCSALWVERNAIFTRNGHCFKSARGQAQFGVGCFPPYGKLGSAEQRQVDQIIGWERRKGCR